MASNGALPGNPIVVIAPQFCVPYPVDFTIARKLILFTDGNYDVFNIPGKNLFEVRARPRILHHRRSILADAAGVPLVSLQKNVWSSHSRWDVYRGDSSDSSNLLFGVKKSSILQFETNLNVFLASNTAEQVCDFKIKEEEYLTSFDIYHGNSNNIIAQLRKMHVVQSIFCGNHEYSNTVYSNVDYVFIAALCVVLNEIKYRDDDDDD